MGKTFSYRVEWSRMKQVNLETNKERTIIVSGVSTAVPNHGVSRNQQQAWFGSAAGWTTQPTLTSNGTVRSYSVTKQSIENACFTKEQAKFNFVIGQFARLVSGGQGRSISRVEINEYLQGVAS